MRVFRTMTGGEQGMPYTIKVILACIALLALVTGAIFGTVYLINLMMDNGGISDERAAEYEAKKSTLQNEKHELKNRIQELNSSVDGFEGGRYMSFVFTELAEEVYSTLFPLMKGDGGNSLAGTLAFSRTELPGLDGKITLAQYAALADAGWGSCIYYDGTDELSSYLGDMRAILSGLDIDMPCAVMCAAAEYHGGYDAIFAEHGIDIVFRPGNAELGYVETEMPEGEIWHPGYLGWCEGKMSTALKNLVKSSVKTGGYAAFEITLNAKAGESGENEDITTSYNEQPKRFSDMLEVFRAEIYSGALDLIAPSQIRERIAEYKHGIALHQAFVDGEIPKLEAQIAEVDDKLKRLYYEYYASEGRD